MFVLFIIQKCYRNVSTHNITSSTLYKKLEFMRGIRNIFVNKYPGLVVMRFKANSFELVLWDVTLIRSRRGQYFGQYTGSVPIGDEFW